MNILVQVHVGKIKSYFTWMRVNEYDTSVEIPVAGGSLMSYTRILPSSQAVAKTLLFSGLTEIPYTASSCKNTSKVSPLKMKDNLR